MGFKLYTTRTCAYCNQIKKFLSAKSINYQTVDVTDDLDARRELHAKYNALTVPVLVKDDGQYMVGLDMPKLFSMIK